MAALVTLCEASHTWDASNSTVSIEGHRSDGQDPIHPDVRFLSSEIPIALLAPGIEPPFVAIERLFDHLQLNPEDAAALNAIYPRRGIHKTAAMKNPNSDQKFTIDISSHRSVLIQSELSPSLARHGLNEILTFFEAVNQAWVGRIMDSLHHLAGVDLTPAHQHAQINFRICDYNPETVSPDSENGCGAHTDYGTFSIIFQDGTSGLEFEDPSSDDTWIPVPGYATVVLTGWCAVILTGANVIAARHRVRRTPGVRRLSAVLFVAPHPEVVLSPLVEMSTPAKPFSRFVEEGMLTVGWFKEFMGKKWRHREGNEEPDARANHMSQDDEIKRLIWA